MTFKAPKLNVSEVTLENDAKLLKMPVLIYLISVIIYMIVLPDAKVYIYMILKWNNGFLERLYPTSGKSNMRRFNSRTVAQMPISEEQSARVNSSF